MLEDTYKPISVVPNPKRFYWSDLWANLIFWPFLLVIMMLYPVYRIGKWIARRIERYADPYEHFYWVTKNWRKFPNDPTMGK